MTVQYLETDYSKKTTFANHLNILKFFLPGIDAKARSVGSISYWTLGLGGEVAVGLSFAGEDGTTVVSSF